MQGAWRAVHACDRRRWPASPWALPDLQRFISIRVRSIGRRTLDSLEEIADVLSNT